MISVADLDRNALSKLRLLLVMGQSRAEIGQA